MINEFEPDKHNVDPNHRTANAAESHEESEFGPDHNVDPNPRHGSSHENDEESDG